MFANKNEVGEGFTQSTVTVYDGENSSQLVATYGEKPSLTVTGKKGYYLEGVFDAQEGGTKYFDSLGNSLLKWESSFPTTLYMRWGDIRTLQEEISVFGNEPQGGGSSGRRTAEVKLSDPFVSALKGNFDEKLKIEYSIDLKTGEGWEASPIRMEVKGYDNTGADKYAVFEVTPTVGTFSTFTGSAKISATDFADGNIYVCVLNTKGAIGALAYPVFYSRNLTLKISFAQAA